MKNENIYLTLLIFNIFFILSAFLIINQRIIFLTGLSIVVFAWIIFVYCKRYVDRILIVFFMGHLIYGLSGPIAGYLLKSQFLKSYYGIFEVEQWEGFLDAYTIATITILFTLILFTNLYNSIGKYKVEKQEKRKYSKMPFVLLLISLFAEVTNYIRAGGLASLLKGKAFYYGQVSDLYITLPSEIFQTLAIFYFFKYFTPIGNKRKHVLLFFIILILCNSVTIFLGERSSLAYLFIVTVFAYSYKKGLFLSKRLIFIIITFYLILTTLYSLRGHTTVLLNGGGIGEFVGRIRPYEILRNLNPAKNEFQSSCYNYLKYYEKLETTAHGKYFVTEFLQFFPRWFLPNKPKDIVTSFRDKYYPELIEKNQGTGFSSFIEGHMNFGNFGIFLYYSMLTIWCVSLDILRYRDKKEEVFMLIYIIIPFVMFRIHRASSGIIYSSIFYTTLFYYFVNIYNNIKDILMKTYQEEIAK